MLAIVAALAAGLALAQEPAADGGTSPQTEQVAAQARQLEQMQRELAELRALVVTLETQAAQNEQLVQQANQLNEQMGALREQIAVAREEDAEQAAQVNAAIQDMIGIEQQLQYGDTSDMDARLASAAEVLGAPASTNVQAARYALANKDGANARLYLWQAIWEAQRQR
jgi:septal ring factor EnvC (AmiA/AmiB activator)